MKRNVIWEWSGEVPMPKKQTSQKRIGRRKSQRDHVSLTVEEANLPCEGDQPSISSRSPVPIPLLPPFPGCLHAVKMASRQPLFVSPLDAHVACYLSHTREHTRPLPAPPFAFPSYLTIFARLSFCLLFYFYSVLWLCLPFAVRTRSALNHHIHYHCHSTIEDCIPGWAHMIPVFGIALLVSKSQCIVHFSSPFPIILHVYKASLVVWPREAKKRHAHTHVHTLRGTFLFPPFVCLDRVAVLYSQQPPPSLVLVLCYLMSPHRELPLLVLPPLEEQHPVSLLRVCTIRNSQFVVDALFSNRLTSSNLVNFQRANGGRRRRSEKKKEKKRKEEERKALKPNSETRKNKGIGRKKEK